MDTSDIQKSKLLFQHCTLVASTEIKFQDIVAFLLRNIEAILTRGNNPSTRILILSGCHGWDSGDDGLTNLACFTSTDKSNPKQSR